MGRLFKFAKTELQYSGGTAKPKYMYIEVLPEQEGTLTYNGAEQFPTWKNLDPLKLLIEGEKSAVNAGTHYITVTPMGNFAWPDDTQTPKQIPYTINRKPVLIIPTQKNTLTYNKQAQSPTWNNFDSNQLDIGGVYQNQVNAGTYTATFTPNSNHCWQDGTYSAKNATWSIGVLTLTAVTLAKGSYVFNGESQAVQLNNFNADFMSIGETSEATNVGTYYVTITLDDTDNTQWSNQTTDVLRYNWQITKLYLTKVTKNTANWEYDGTEHIFEFNNFDADFIEIDGDTRATDPGTYTTTFSLKDTANTAWTGNTTNNIILSITCNKKKLAIPSLDFADYPTFTDNWIDAKDLNWSNYDSTLMWCEGREYEAANNYYAEFEVKDNDRYCFKNGSDKVNCLWGINPDIIDRSDYPVLDTSLEECTNTYTIRLPMSALYWKDLKSVVLARLLKYDDSKMYYDPTQGAVNEFEPGKGYQLNIYADKNHRPFHINNPLTTITLYVKSE